MLFVFPFPFIVAFQSVPLGLCLVLYVPFSLSKETLFTVILISGQTTWRVPVLRVPAVTSLPKRPFRSDNFNFRGIYMYDICIRVFISIIVEVSREIEILVFNRSFLLDSPLFIKPYLMQASYIKREF